MFTPTLLHCRLRNCAYQIAFSCPRILQICVSFTGAPFITATPKVLIPSYGIDLGFKDPLLHELHYRRVHNKECSYMCDSTCGGLYLLRGTLETRRRMNSLIQPLDTPYIHFMCAKTCAVFKNLFATLGISRVVRIALI